MTRYSEKAKERPFHFFKSSKELRELILDPINSRQAQIKYRILRKENLYAIKCEKCSTEIGDNLFEARFLSSM